jgi:hypothetical protein
VIEIGSKLEGTCGAVWLTNGVVTHPSIRRKERVGLAKFPYFSSAYR